MSETLTPYIGVTAPHPRSGKTYVALTLEKAFRGMNVPLHKSFKVNNMSDCLMERLLAERQDLTWEEAEKLKDDPKSGVRERLCEISQALRKDNPAAMAEEAFMRMLFGGIMTGIMFEPETHLLIERAKTYGGGLIVIDTPDEVRRERLAKEGLHVPAETNAVEQERPSHQEVIRLCEEAGVRVWHLDNSRHLEVAVDNPYYQELMGIVAQCETDAHRLLQLA